MTTELQKRLINESLLGFIGEGFSVVAATDGVRTEYFGLVGGAVVKYHLLLASVLHGISLMRPSSVTINDQIAQDESRKMAPWPADIRNSNDFLRTVRRVLKKSGDDDLIAQERLREILKGLEAAFLAAKMEPVRVDKLP